MVSHNPILVALDTATAEQAIQLAQQVAPSVGGFKVGLRLLLGPGPATISAVAGLGKPVFADAKLHDIPSQVEPAAARLGEFGARWVTAHTGGGRGMLEAAVAGLSRGAAAEAGILAVTVLTSLAHADLTAIGIGATPGKLTSRMARVAHSAGCEGVICSPQELGVVAEVAPDLVKVTPGIRPGGDAADDQARTAGPADALQRGADWLVVGRPITEAPDPAAAAAAMWKEIQGADHTRV